MERCPGRPSHIGTAGLDRTGASSKQFHQHHTSSEVDQEGSRFGVRSVAEVVRHGRLRWFGHLERKSGDDLVSACRNVSK